MSVSFSTRFPSVVGAVRGARAGRALARARHVVPACARAGGDGRARGRGWSARAGAAAARDASSGVASSGEEKRAVVKLPTSDESENLLKIRHTVRMRRRMGVGFGKGGARARGRRRGRGSSGRDARGWGGG